MQSGSPPNPSEDPPPLYTMANLIGTVIALITLVSPMYFIRHFSSDTLTIRPISTPMNAPP